MMNFKEMMLTKWIRNKAAEIKAAFKEDFTKNSELTVDQRDRKRSRAVSRITAGMMAVMMLSSMFGITAFAEAAAADGGGDGVETFNTVVQFIVDWVARIGLVIGFIGAIQFALGFKDDSADGKTRGLMCLASGFIVFAVAKAYDMFTM
ncbi:hypothetical protein [Ruminococcus sp.]|uniref:hypothetical protein n=1 Tax=Ruminococcus sp. TaxID=41978 RepID=UPI002585BBFF|nr:hypothetical protein [Ruminococcus sp.]